MKMQKSVQNETNLYLAPLQGFTDFIYRSAYSKIFPGIDAFFIPYISVKNKEILNKYKREIFPENNPKTKVVPQVLAKDADEMLFLSKVLENTGYKEINLNLGCPYPMVTNRQKGAGLLPHPEKISSILNSFFDKTKLKLSIKLRAGLLTENELENVILVLNQFPLSEVILHPRVAKQLYSGEIIETAFQFATQNLNHNLTYNGDIFSLYDFDNYKQKFSQINSWMLGRGILKNPFLPAEIKNITITESEKWTKLWDFHQLVFEGYKASVDNEGNVLNKMKQFWTYFACSFPNSKKGLKQIKKVKNYSNYQAAIISIFNQYN